ncbi:hypothetical protein AHAS_Ahas06G0044900 [Arachis hypogaea]
MLLPSSFEASLSSGIETQDLNSMIAQACMNIENQNSCLANIQNELVKIGPPSPTSVLSAALGATINEARGAIDKITKFTTFSVSNREQLAIEDCKELLDYSVSELAWSMGEMRRIRGGDTSAQYEGNLEAWLSAALSNQDTCIEGFEGTDRRLESYISGSLTQVTQLISNVLSLYTQLHKLPFSPPRKTNTLNVTTVVDEFPDWMSDGDEQLLKAKSPPHGRADAVVALDGSGHFRSIMEAVNAAPSHSNTRYVIYVKQGLYRENVDMKKKMTNIMLVGDGIGRTILTSNRNFMQGWTTFRTATLAVVAKGFVAVNMTFRNTAGGINHQAVALRSGADLSAFYSCSFEGYQDTLYTHSMRQFYRNCDIYGTVDFIFGNAAVVFQDCNIYPRLPMSNQFNAITAQGRTDVNQNTGISIHNCTITAAADLAASNGTTKTYLGRPWKLYSRTVYMQSFMDSLIDPAGWVAWSGDFALDTLYYAEYDNWGAGSNTSSRVTWAGYDVLLDSIGAINFTVSNFIFGDVWLPATGVPYLASLY